MLHNQKEIEVLSVKINRDMTFAGHVKTTAKKAAGRLMDVLRISHLVVGNAL